MKKNIWHSQIIKGIVLSLIFLPLSLSPAWAQVTVYEVIKTVTPYEDITGGTVIDLQGNVGNDLSKVLFDADGNANFNAAEQVTAFPIGFDFGYNGYTMKYFLLTGDGAIMLYADKVVSTSAHVVGLASPAYAFAGDNCQNSFGVVAREGAFGYNDTEISYKLEGEAGNRVLTIQYKNLGWRSTSWDVNEIAKVQLQYRLFEATGNIEMKLNNWKPFEGVDCGKGNWVIAGLNGDGKSRNWMFLKDYDAADYGPNADWGYYKVEMIDYNHDSYPEDGTTWTFVAPTLCQTPTLAPADVALTSTTTGISGTFTKGNGDHQLVLVGTNATLKAGPIDKTKYNVGDKIGGATVAAITEEGTFQTADNLLASTTYYIHVYTFNDLCSNGPLYNATPATASIITKPAAPMSISVSDIDKNSFKVSTVANGNYPVLLAITDVQGIYTYTSGAQDWLEAGNFGTPTGNYAVGDEISGGGKVIFNGTPNGSIALDELQTGTTYYLRAWSGDGNGSYSSKVVDLAVATAAELPWSVAIDEKVGYNASLPGWKKYNSDTWGSDPDYSHYLFADITLSGQTGTTWIETPYIYMGQYGTAMITSLGGSQGAGFMAGDWTLAEGDKIRFQLTKDEVKYTDVITITGAQIEKLTRSALTPVDTTFTEMAGEKVRLRVLVERTSAGQFRLGPINLTAVPAPTENISNVNIDEMSAQQVYTLQGIYTSKPRKGLYIRNGKKVIIK